MVIKGAEKKEKENKTVYTHHLTHSNHWNGVNKYETKHISYK